MQEAVKESEDQLPAMDLKLAGQDPFAQMYEASFDKAVRPKVVSISYGRTKNMGNYNNRKLSVVVDIPQGVSVEAAVKAAQRYVDRKLDGADSQLDRREQMQYRLDYPDTFAVSLLEEARVWLSENPKPLTEFDEIFEQLIATNEDSDNPPFVSNYPED